ncbi:MAG TPA: dockerin type I domain-containing protein, partial [Candidatus Hydrogenedentes bacterium]|nr:dockerin type I domain-containing protein [Candidatus Hydrogenedentota bacterium]
LIMQGGCPVEADMRVFTGPLRRRTRLGGLFSALGTELKELLVCSLFYDLRFWRNHKTHAIIWVSTWQKLLSRLHKKKRPKVERASYFSFVPWRDHELVEELRRELDWQIPPGRTCTMRFDCRLHILRDTLSVLYAGVSEKDVNFSIIEPGRARLIVAGFNQNVFPDGIVAYVQFAIAAGAPDAVYLVAPVAVLISDPWGLDIPAAGIAGAIIVGTGGLEGSDIDGDGVCNATDVQLVVNSALGLAVAHDCDVDGDGVVNALDIQRVINAALGIG